jgi:hypothetical protein
MMPSSVLPDMKLLGVVELDATTFQMTVLESGDARTYTMTVGVGRWMDGDRFILTPDPRHSRLVEIWSAYLLEKKLDDYIEGRGQGMPPAAPQTFGPLPPVPVLPRR